MSLMLMLMAAAGAIASGEKWGPRFFRENLNGVTYANDLFVAVGGYGKILTSPDGVTWMTRTSGTTNNLNGVTYGGGQFVAVGASGQVVTSPPPSITTV